MSGHGVIASPRVDEGTFIGIAWGGTALALLFLISRLAIRLSSYRRLFWDDFFVVVAWLMFLANTIIWQLYKGKLYENLLFSAGLIPFQLDLITNVREYLKASVVIIIFFYSTLWFIKFSFLIFFRRLGNKVKGQKIHWWIVFGLTLVTYIISFGTLEYRCLLGSFNYQVTHCTSDSAINFVRATLYYNMAMDVITDAAIMTIPIHLLWNVKINLKQKLALMGIFSLTIFIMVFAIVRAAVVGANSYQPDESWLYMWSSIEQTVAIIIASLASFRVLFTKQADRPSGFRETSSFMDKLNNSSWTRWLIPVSQIGSRFRSSKGSKGSSSNSTSGSEADMTVSSTNRNYTGTGTGNQNMEKVKSSSVNKIHVTTDFSAVSVSKPGTPQKPENFV